MIPVARARAALLGLAALAFACRGDDGGDEADTQAELDSGGSESSDTSSETETETDTGGAPLTGTCAQACSEPVDCCPEGAIGCPGDYPNDWSCEAGLCVAAGCPSDAACQELIPNPELECHAIAGVGSCFVPCADDRACTAFPDGACSGVADDGATFCEFPFACQSDADCGGQGKCVIETGECRCGQDSDCTAPGLVCAP